MYFSVDYMMCIYMSPPLRVDEERMEDMNMMVNTKSDNRDSNMLLLLPLSLVRCFRSAAFYIILCLLMIYYIYKVLVLRNTSF